MSQGLMGFLMLAGIIFTLVLVVCWIALPFYVQGTNRRLDKIIQLMEVANKK